MNTPELSLQRITPSLWEAALAGDHALAAALDVSIAPAWIKKRQLYYLSSKQILPTAWGVYFLLVDTTEGPWLVGLAGFNGPPSKAGWVELGYEIAPSFRRRGIATAATAQLVALALAATEPIVFGIEALTSAAENYSTRVLRNNGFQRVEASTEYYWRWRRAR
ncbi:MAG: GNAT family N-acetyltransferase [Lewinella sp.]|nr:GNAT family N-acetyltransferase [Lewinella sp.]